MLVVSQLLISVMMLNGYDNRESAGTNVTGENFHLKCVNFHLKLRRLCHCYKCAQISKVLHTCSFDYKLTLCNSREAFRFKDI